MLKFEKVVREEKRKERVESFGARDDADDGCLYQ